MCTYCLRATHRPRRSTQATWSSKVLHRPPSPSALQER
jgi:hypothetical protein